MIPAGDDDAGVARIEERRMNPAGDDDAGVARIEERRMNPAGDDAERSDEEEWRA
jgi:23S rRNA pseudouridine1911/1915/1917 synthase